MDLNTLDALSRTCCQIRANLLQYRNRLVQQTLHCENEFRDAKSSESDKPGQKWHILGEAGHLVSGKVSTCARDLVSDCRRCGRIVCRVCPPFFPTSISPEPSLHWSCPKLTIYMEIELYIQTPSPLAPPLPPPPPLPHLPLRPPLPPHLLQFIPLHLHNQHPPLRPLRCLSRNRRHHVQPRLDMAHTVRYQLRGLGDWDWGGE